MKKGRFIWDRDKQCFVPYDKIKRRSTARLQVIEDIDPFISPIDRKVVGGRRQKRDHMKAHGVVEYEPLPDRKGPEVTQAEVAQSFKDAFEIHGHGD